MIKCVETKLDKKNLLGCKIFGDFRAVGFS